MCASSVVTFTFESILNVFACILCIFFFSQTLREEKTSHDKEMNNMRARCEEEANQMKESQARALEEVSKKHRVTLENALNNAEKDKNRLLAVSTFSYIFSWTPRLDQYTGLMMELYG